jgi:hypothetical protein
MACQFTQAHSQADTCLLHVFHHCRQRRKSQQHHVTDFVVLQLQHTSFDVPAGDTAEAPAMMYPLVKSYKTSCDVPAGELSTPAVMYPLVKHSKPAMMYPLVKSQQV